MHKLFSTHASMQVLDGENIFLSYQVIGKLGTGNSTVYSVKKEGAKEEVAMKEIVIKHEQNMTDFMREVQLMKTISKHNHPNIIGFFDYCILIRESEYENLRLAYMLFEKAITSLDKLIGIREPKKQYFSTALIKTFLQKCVCVHKFLQEQKIAHCDIKPENILISDVETLEMKICDIGSGKLMKNENTFNQTIAGTVPFLSPELMNNLANTRTNHNPFKSDVYSLGLCMLYLITFQKFSQSQRSWLSEEAFLEVVSEWKRQAVIICDHDQLISLMLDSMLISDQKRRPDFLRLHTLMMECDTPDINDMMKAPSNEEDSAKLTLNVDSDSNLGSSLLMDTPLPKSRHTNKKSNFANHKNSQSQNNLMKVDNHSIFRIHQGTPVMKKSSGFSNARIPQIQNTLNQQNFSNSPIRRKSMRQPEPIAIQNIPMRTSSFLNDDKHHSQSQFFQSPFKVPPHHVQTEQSTRQIHRKGNSAGNMKLTPIDIKSLQSTKTSFFAESPQKKRLAGSPTCIPQLIRLLDSVDAIKEIVEYFDCQTDPPELKLVVLVDQAKPDCLQRVAEIGRLLKVKELSVVLQCRKSKTKQTLVPVVKGLLDSLKLLRDVEMLEILMDRVEFKESEISQLTFPKLKSLHLELLKCDTDRKSVNRLVRALVPDKLTSLTLRIGFYGFDDICPIIDSICPQRSLTYLSLAFTHVNLDDKQHKRLHDVISQITTLRTLLLSFHCSTLNLKQAQWNLNPNLQELVLDYNKTQLDQALTSLALGLHKLTGLVTLELGLAHQQAQPQNLKLLFEYIRKLTTIRELKLSFESMSVVDNTIVQILTEKLKFLTNLEVLQLNFRSNDITQNAMDSLVTLAATMIPIGKIQQLELLLPRLCSTQSIIEKCPKTLDVRSTYNDVESFYLFLCDQTLLASRMEYYSRNLDPILNHCSEKDHGPTFTCIDCTSSPAHRAKLCLQCTQNCHFGHHIVLDEVVPRINGTMSKLRQCECTFEGCNSIKRQGCTSTLGEIRQLVRICETCNPDRYMCTYCSMNGHNGHTLRAKEYLVSFECSQI